MRLDGISFEELDFMEMTWNFKLSDGTRSSYNDVETIPQMDRIKKVILYEDGSKLNGMQLQTKQSTLINAFGELLGTQKVITLKDNEVLMGV